MCVWEYMHMLACLHTTRCVCVLFSVTLTKKRENPTGDPYHEWHSHAARVFQNSLRRDEYSRTNDCPNDYGDSPEQGHLFLQFHLLLGGVSLGVFICSERFFLSEIALRWNPLGHSLSGHLIYKLQHNCAHTFAHSFTLFNTTVCGSTRGQNERCSHGMK